MDHPVCRRLLVRKCLARALLWSAVGCMGAAVAVAGEKEDAEAAKWERLERDGRTHYDGPLIVDAEKEAREALERNPPGSPRPSSAGTTDAERKAGAPAPASASPESVAMQGFDWSQLLAGGGLVSDGLQLSLGTSGEPFRFGQSYRLFLGLTNHALAPRVIEGMPACDSLGRTATLVFRVRSDQGEEFEVPNRFRDRTVAHPHAPLEIGAGSSLTGLVDFAGLGLGSEIPFDVLRTSQTLFVSAEVKELGLASNEVALQIDPASVPQ